MPKTYRTRGVALDDETLQMLADLCKWISERGLGVKVSYSHAVRVALRRLHKQMLAEREGEPS